MPSEAFQQLIERAVTDEAFASRLQSDRDAALADYELTEDERQALLSGDPEKLSALGLDERITKTYKIW